MPRTRSAKKPGCFNQVKPTLMFTDSPPERLPRRLCSPINAADNPITAHVLYAEDGLETTWVSPQFHPSMLEMGEAPKRGRRRKKDTENIGKSAMVSQSTTRSRRPVRKSSVLSSTTPNLGERRFPKGFKPLLFLGDSSRKDKDQKMGTGDEEAHVGDTDCNVDSAIMSGVEHWRSCTSAKNMRQSFSDEEQMEMGENDNTGYHGRVHIQSMVGIGRGGSVTRSRISSVSHLDKRRCHPYRDDDEDDVERCGKDSVFHNPRITALKDNSASTSTSRRHHTSNHPEDVFVAPDENFECNLNYSNLNNLHDWGPDASQDYGQSPRFDRINMKYQEEVRNKIDDARDRSGEVCLQKQLIRDLSKGGCDGTDKKGKVLAADTPVSDYGVRVSLRRRRNLLPKQYRDRLLLDSK